LAKSLEFLPAIVTMHAAMLVTFSGKGVDGMKRLWFKKIIVFVLSLFLLLAPAMAFAQTGQAKTGAPPVEQPLVSEGSFAVRLASALSVATTDDEVMAESQLGDLGIAPRNGWIADYPVTPDKSSSCRMPW
jgi:hypothetical protein